MAEEAVPSTPAQGADYEPSEQEQKLVGEVNQKFDKWRGEKKPYEIQWFQNSSALRGNTESVWNDGVGRLENPDIPAYRARLPVNRILPKIRARIAKFLKQRPIPVVVPASQDREDHMNARATQRVLDYVWRSNGLESKYKESLLWSQVAGKGFWWVYWDTNAMARIKQDDPFGRSKVIESPEGDVAIEVGSPFEVFVSDPGKLRIGDQPEIIRAKIRQVDDVRMRYPDKANYIKGESGRHDAFQYERQIANMGTTGRDGGRHADIPSGVGPDENEGPFCLVKELFTKPCGKFPQGRYVVVAGDVLLKTSEILPYNFGKFSNPYPVVEFADTETPGQFWPTTHIEQMIGLQRGYNSLRSDLEQHIKHLKHPKIFIPEQFRMSKDSWTKEAGEVIRYVAMPGIPPPTPWVPPLISGDVWRLLDTYKSEFDDVSMIYPAMQGGVGQASSGFQTNLLQEAADSVHAPDIRGHEISLEDVHIKMRRIIAMGWDVPRLVAVAGRNFEPEVFEFSSDQIDEHADIIIQTGSALSNSPAVRSQQVFELFNSGLLGIQDDPEVRRTALSLLNLNTQDSVQEVTHRDENLSRLENLEIGRGEQVDYPAPWENHNIHWTFHSDQLKSPETKKWPPERKQALIAHLVMHAKYINPANAVSIALQYGLDELVPLIQPPAPPPAPAAPGTPPSPPGVPGVPPPPPIPGPSPEPAPGGPSPLPAPLAPPPAPGGAVAPF